MSFDILLVEDDKDLSEALGQLIQDEGYSVNIVNNGKEALDYLGTHNPLPRVILLDIMMPVMDGIEFRAKQRQDSRIAAIPVIVISAGDLSPQKTQGLGAVDCLRKPLNLDRLFELVKQIVAA